MNQLYQIRADLVHFVVLLALRESFFIACSCLTDISLQNVQTRYGVVARYIVSQTILTLQNLVFHELFLHLLQRKDLAIQSRESFRANLSVKKLSNTNLVVIACLAERLQIIQDAIQILRIQFGL